MCAHRAWTHRRQADSATAGVTENAGSDDCYQRVEHPPAVSQRLGAGESWKDGAGALAQYGAQPQAGTRGRGKEIYHMQDHDGNQLPLAEHIRSILPSPVPDGVTEGVYQALFEMAGLADLPTGPGQKFHMRRAVEFLEKAVDSLRCPEDPDEVEEGTAPLPVPAATPARASPGAGTRLSTRDLRRAAARP